VIASYKWLYCYYILPVPDNPAIKLSESGSSLFAGNKQSYICIVEGWPPPTVKWLKNNTILKEGKGQEEHVNLTLDFPELELHHTGSYTCEASNEITNNTRIVNVTVLCKHNCYSTVP